MDYPKGSIMWRHMLAESATGIKEWLTKSNRLNKTLAVIIILILASIGFYFLGIPGAFLGVLIAVGMIDEFFGKKSTKEHKIRQVFCSQCGAKQDWAEDKLCEICRSPLRR
jgi:hypothetical protein